MTAARRLLPKSEIDEALEKALAFMRANPDVGGVDIRSDGVTVFPKSENRAGSAFDAWKAKDKVRDRPARNT